MTAGAVSRPWGSGAAAAAVNGVSALQSKEARGLYTEGGEDDTSDDTGVAGGAGAAVDVAALNASPLPKEDPSYGCRYYRAVFAVGKGAVAARA